MVANGRCVLVVDDDPRVLSVLSLALRKAGASATTAPDPEAAIETLATLPETGDLAVVSDFDLRAERNGLHVLQTVRDVRPDARRVLMSGSGSAHALAGDVDGVIEAFLEKPFSLQELVAIVTSRKGGVARER